MRSTFFHVILAVAWCGCQTAPLPTVDLSEPGWTHRHGQAVWRPRAGQPDVAGELTLATHADGRWWIEFSKPPLPIIVAARTSDGWWLKSAIHGEFKGRGIPPPHTAWLLLAAALANEPMQPDWQSMQSVDGWSMENGKTGESLKGFLNP